MHRPEPDGNLVDGSPDNCHTPRVKRFSQLCHHDLRKHNEPPFWEKFTSTGKNLPVHVKVTGGKDLSFPVCTIHLISGLCPPSPPGT